MMKSGFTLVVMLAVLWFSGCPPAPPQSDSSNKEAIDATSPWAEVSPSADCSVGTGDYTTRRLAVPNGWLYLTIAHCSHGISATQVFVYDPSRDKLAQPLVGPETERK